MTDRATGTGMTAASTHAGAQYEIINAEELARRWSLPESWVRDQTRSRATDPIPHLRFGRYVRFRWGSPELNGWLERRMVGGNRLGRHFR